MLISTKGRYALRVMIDLAEHRATGRIPLKEIAQRQSISEKYLENILSTLVRAGLLSGMRGKGGGYKLTREPDQYTAGEILRLTEGSLAPVACLDGDCSGCERAETCPTLDMWKNLDKLINDYLDGITLESLTGGPQDYDYVI